MSRLHDHLTGKVRRDEEKKKRDADIEEQKKIEEMMSENAHPVMINPDILIPWVLSRRLK